MLRLRAVLMAYISRRPHNYFIENRQLIQVIWFWFWTLFEKKRNNLDTVVFFSMCISRYIVTLVSWNRHVKWNKIFEISIRHHQRKIRFLFLDKKVLTFNHIGVDIAAARFPNGWKCYVVVIIHQSCTDQSSPWNMQR